MKIFIIYYLKQIFLVASTNQSNIYNTYNKFTTINSELINSIIYFTTNHHKIVLLLLINILADQRPTIITYLNCYSSLVDKKYIDIQILFNKSI